MSWIVKFDKDNWQKVYGSFFSSEFINHQNGEFHFLNNQLVFKGDAHEIAIIYSDIVNVGKKNTNLGLSTHIRIETKDKKIYFLLLPDADFYIGKLLEKSHSIIRAKKIIIPLQFRILKTILWSFFVCSLVFILKIGHEYPYSIFIAKALLVYMLIVIPSIIFMTNELKSGKSEGLFASPKNLFKVIYFVPYLGLLLGAEYLCRYRSVAIGKNKNT